MFEARLAQGVLLRKLLDSMKDLVQARPIISPEFYLQVRRRQRIGRMQLADEGGPSSALKMLSG